MPRQQKLEVYRTPIRFHGAYVAAPSQKVALQAWGSDSDLFAQKIAEQVNDPELMKEPLAHPGEIIRTLRGTTEEQVEALGSKAAKKLRSGLPSQILDPAEPAWPRPSVKCRRLSSDNLMRSKHSRPNLPPSNRN